MPWKRLGCLGYSQKDTFVQDYDAPEAAGHSNWYMCSQKYFIFQDFDPPEAAGHSSTGFEVATNRGGGKVFQKLFPWSPIA